MKKKATLLLLITFLLVFSGCPTPTTPLFVELTSSVTTITEGESVTFTASPEGGSTGSYSFSWFIDLNQETGETGSTFTKTFNNAGNYVVRVEVGDGEKIASDTVNITVEEDETPDPLSITLSPSVNQEIDEGDSLNFSVATSGGAGSNTISWYVNTVVQSGQTGSTFSHTFNTAGTYTVKVRVENGEEVEE
ncbi:MAG: PKD domain-containing protein, partial [Spirochaetia bacterium]|nr:PKD domain-containing protein [Spirochaetia bacterium]